jgi:hypothetical protein
MWACLLLSDSGPAGCRRFGPARTVNRPVNLSLRVPTQMGLCKMEHKRGK